MDTEEGWPLWIWKTTIGFLWTVGSVLYGILESWVRFFYAAHKDLSNEIVVLTGAAGGFGTLLAEKMAKKGCAIILLDINEKEVRNLAEKVNKLCAPSNTVLAYKCDITSQEEVEKVSQTIVQDVGHPTMLINNAGVVAGKYFKDLEQKDVLRTFNVNVLSHYMLVKQFLPYMLETNHGHVVSVASIVGIKAMAGILEYAPSKAAAVAYMDALRQEISVLGRDGIHCTTILPYQVTTELFNGCSIRFKNFPTLNLLTPDYVTDKIIEAIETNQITLYIPRSCYVIGVLLRILPERSIDALFNFLGANHAMQTFVGRGKKDS